MKTKKPNYTLLILILLLMFTAALPRLCSFAAGGGKNYAGDYRPHNHDAYYYLRMAEYFSGSGRGFSEGTDLLRYAPEGIRFDDAPLLLSELTALAGKLFFGSAASPVSRAASLLELFLPVLCIIPVLLLLSLVLEDLHLEDGLIPAGIAAGILSSLNYMYLIRTLPGYFDTDQLILFFSCFLMYFLYRIVTGRRVYASIACFGITAGFFARWWSGNIFFIIIAAGVLILCALADLIFCKSKDNLAALCLTALSVPAGILVIAGKNIFLSAIGRIFIMARLKADESFRPGEEWFPNAYLSVSEMSSPDVLKGGFFGLFRAVSSSGPSGIINYAGGICVCIAALFGFALLLRSLRTKNASKIHSCILLLLWALASAIASVIALRYQLVLSLPAALLSGITIAWLYRRLSPKPALDRSLLTIVVMTALLFPTIHASWLSAGTKTQQIATRDMEEAMELLRDTTDPAAVLASWWDYGYYYEQYSERATLFDGGSQSGIRLYWMAKALSTDDRELTAAILKMLSSSGDKATLMLGEHFGDGRKAVMVLQTILAMDENEAKDCLTGSFGLSGEDANAVLSCTHPKDAPPIVLLISSDMISKSIWFPAFGSWDNTGAQKPEDFYWLTGNWKAAPSGGSDGHYSIRQSGMTAELTITPRNLQTAGSITAKCTLIKDGGEPSACSIRNIYYIGPDRHELYEQTDMNEIIPGDSELYDLILNEKAGELTISMISPALSDSVCGELYFKDGLWQDVYRRLDPEDDTSAGSLTVSLWSEE